ncbi:sigma-54-dependent Fis family transcriptional regulator [Roseateles amylovorans]|uniref:Sigma-54-dependent Fis family transcriptional regulator n=1 Tax=Roseateles amylovorans TaxID=2978473 RepID=A0ABY6AYI6_9BURK|nr:sigma-54-dependent Fis family transcriptional regulator [Roseateles amylovorans]UXH77747.1 sigma-54-dependent Fis family transcriptional regulator [Roseateles amylovorans]
MSDRALASSVVERARQRFFIDGTDPGASIPAHVSRSWRRCDALSPALQRPAVAEPVLRGELSVRREASAWLRQCAQPELDGLAEHVLGQGCVVILSDASGLILDEVGSPDFLPKAQRIALTPGVDWSESQRGTNAIGTALHEREGLMVLGGEHFLAQNGALGCAAAPIFNARGELVGVLDISGEDIHVDVHALGLVRMAASQVEHRMMSNGRRDGQLVRFHRRPGLLGTPREGLLSVLDGQIVGANRTALSLLGMVWEEALGAPAERLLGARWQRLQSGSGLLVNPDGRQLAVSIEAPQRADTPIRRASTGPLERVSHADPRAQSGHTTDPPDVLAPLLANAMRIAAAGLPILVSGETGSGKDVFVRRLHRASHRASGPLVAVNCAALPESLIEAELFGYEDGAFTGARRRGLPGRLREAHGGMLFLDEIGDMPLSMQTRLLRVLEARVVRPLGGSQDIAVDFDLVCATHRDLAALVGQGLFRQDLLYRLQGHVVCIPPLRSRADRRALMSRLMDEAGGAAKGLRLTPAALDALERQPWPGNVRELLSLLRSVVALAEPGATLDVSDLGLPDAVAAAPRETAQVMGAVDGAGQRAQSGLLASLTDEAIRRALAECGGNVAGAARRLGLHRSTLYRYLARRRGEGERGFEGVSG